MKQLVEFTQVGRRKMAWAAELEWEEAAIEEHVAASGALASRNVTALFTAPSAGKIYAGLFPVGVFRLAGHDQSLSA